MRRLVQRGFALSAQLALFGVEGGSDHLVRAWHHTYGLPVVISNCSNNYGPCHFPEKLIPLIILNALEGQAMPVYGKGENVRDWLYVEDHARAPSDRRARPRRRELQCRGQWRAHEHRGGARHLRADGRAAPDAVGPRERLISFVADRPGHDLRYAIDARKIRHELGWAPQETFETGLRKTVQWYLTTGRGGSASARKSIAASAWGRSLMVSVCVIARRGSGHEGHHSCRRRRHAALSGDARRLQATAAGLRQADDLLSAVDADARRHSRHSDHHHAAGSAAVSARCWATARNWACRSAMRCRRSRAGLPRPSSSAATSSAPTTCALVLGDNIFYGHGLPELHGHGRGAAHRAPPFSPTSCRIPSATAWSNSTPAGKARVDRGKAADSRSRTRP